MFRKQFAGPPVLIPLPDGRRWTLHEKFSYETDAGLFLEVPKGFVTDLGSIPRLFWNILPPFGTYTGAVVLHDWLYSEHRKKHADYSRMYADTVLYEAMCDLGVGRVCRGVIWFGVRVGGWAAWNGKGSS